MTERDYIIASTLAEVRAARAVVGRLTSSPTVERAVPKTALMHINRELSDMEEALSHMLKVTT